MTLLKGAYLSISRSFCASYNSCQITPPWLDLLGLDCTFYIVPEHHSMSRSSQRALLPGGRSLSCRLTNWQWSSVNHRTVCSVLSTFCITCSSNSDNTLMYNYAVIIIELLSTSHHAFNYFLVLFFLFSSPFSTNWGICCRVPNTCPLPASFSQHSGYLDSHYIINCLASHSSLFIGFSIIYFSCGCGKILV